jgi:hypothetical protein
MKQFSLFLVAAVFFILGCEELEELTQDHADDNITKYIIPSGEHYARQNSYEPLIAKAIKFKAMFDSSAIYQTVKAGNQGDINKLHGMSDCNTPHQSNSARFGWRWYAQRLEIWAYAYVNNERKFTFITAVAINAYSQYELSFIDSEYVFKVNDVSVKLPRFCNLDASGYKLYPYFGGDETAPHEITIRIEEIE